MTVGVSHTYGGFVVIADMDTGLRFDLTPDMAQTAASELDYLAQNATSHIIYIIKALDERALRYAAHASDASKMVADLREHAILAKWWGEQ